MAHAKYAKVVDGLIADLVVVDPSNVPDWIAAEYIPEEDVVLRDKTQAELDAEAALAAERARSKRNSLLTASDWTQVADAPVEQAAWATYRSLLRDVPQQSGFPNDITWPTEPEG